jgi:hypothetical protein
MRNIAVIDESFDNNQTASYQLLIQYGGQSYAFALLDSFSMKYIALKNIWYHKTVSPEMQGDHLRNLIHTDNYLSRNFHKILFMYLSPSVVLVPDPLFQAGHPDAYFKFAFPPAPGDIILNHRLTSIDSQVLFSLPQSLHQYLSGSFDSVRIFHQSVPLIDSALRYSKQSQSQNCVYLNAHAGFIDLVLVQSNQLKFYNCFSIRNSEDLLFFVLYLFDQFNLSQETTPVILAGFIEFYEDADRLLGKYIRTISRKDRDPGFSYSHTFSNLQIHQYSALINLAHCV